ncbi:MAG: hypothetical protein M1840_006662 [Geoglossum simile]|nr:MAG: hypothetical protein M1840_006662 [Geoglossum simile]
MTARGNLTSYASSIWKLPEAVQDFTHLLPDINMTRDHILITSPAPFRVQEIQCLYATSGRYAPTLRIMFYTLSVVSLFFRTRDWIAGVSMGIVMSYSAVAAIHAIIMVSKRQLLESSKMEMASIATAGLVEAPKIPIWPMIWDEDCDAVLAIVGTAVLVMAPMVIWSGTFHATFRGTSKYRFIIVGWFLLLLMGLICAFVNEVHVDKWAVAQFRFCSPGGDLPDLDLATGFSLRGRKQPNKSFNDTIWDIFSNASTSQWLPPTCVYPCFDVPPALRQASNAKVISSSGTWPSTSNYSNVKAGWSLMLTAIILIGISMSIMIAIFILQKQGLLQYGDRGRLMGEDRTPMWLDYGAKGLTGASFFFFVAWIEYTLWPYPYTERFADVGQWGQLTTVILVLAVAAYKFICERCQAPQPHALNVGLTSLNGTPGA